MKINENLPFDYTYLIDRLKEYAYPRDKITQLLRKGEIIRVRKGLYITPENNNSYLKEILAGMIYGPSYISLEYALAYYQMIPEQVQTITSVTTQKPKLYQTPVGTFRYQHIRMDLFHLGLDYATLAEKGFLLASREKVLCDLVYFRFRNLKAHNVAAFLLEDMRIDLNELKTLNTKNLSEWINIYKNPSITGLVTYLKEVTR